MENSTEEPKDGGTHAGTIRVLSLSCVFPNPAQPVFGTFVCSRLRRLGELLECKVVAPVPMYDYSQTGARWIGKRGIPPYRQEGPLEVLHPRWFYPPGGSVLNPGLLAIQLARPLARLRRRFPFELIDAHFGYPDGIAAAILARRFNVPFVVTLRGNEPMHAQRASVRRALSFAFRHAARVIALSSRLRDFAVSLGAAPEKTVVIPNGVDLEVFRPRNRAAMREKHGLRPDEKVVLSAGALIERKGHHRVACALGMLRARGVEARLVIAGAAGPEGRFEARIREIVSRLGLDSAVSFTGQVSAQTLAELMAAVDVFCLASTREGWPNVVHEALACGTPVVSTDVGAVPDMIPSPAYGRVVAPGDQHGLEDALAWALRRPWDREEISRWAQLRSWDRVAKEVAAEFGEVMERGRSFCR
jgi:glycosyltransferase involved in cell wall biosynthesis